MKCSCPSCTDEVVQGRKMCERHRQMFNAASRRRRGNLKAQGLCMRCGKRPSAPGYVECSECLIVHRGYGRSRASWYNAKRRKDEQIFKREVMDLFGGKCACCGEAELAFLTIDHINGDGKKHRAEVKSPAIYRDILKRPDRYALQVLCFNCNHAKSIYGVCPHQKH